MFWGSSGVNIVRSYVDYIRLTVLWVDTRGKESATRNGTIGVDVSFFSSEYSLVFVECRICI